MNHRWKNDSCINCGIKRKKVTVKILMAVVNHPPWEAYKYKQTHHFSFDGVKWRSERPSCQKINSASAKICYEVDLKAYCRDIDKAKSGYGA